MSTKRNLLFNWVALVILVLYSCATQGTLSGGPKDTFPPKIDTLKSTPNLQTNFRPQNISLYFDEFIKLNNPAKEIVVSPPLNYPIISTARGKQIKIIINEKDTLKENATYSINFGNAIQDFNESNKLANFNFVFSTGDYIDSLSISGKVLDAYTKKPVDQAIVLLYDNLSDSIIYRERPFYFARTDKEGKYQINNIKNDSFQIFAILDQNLNYFKDASESMAFIDSTIILTDSTSKIFNLDIFHMDPELALITKDVKEPGIVRMMFNKSLDSLPPFSFSEKLTHYAGIEKDSMWIWYDTTGISATQLYLMEDTISVKYKTRASSKPKKIEVNKANGKISVFDNFSIKSAYPVIKIDTSKIVLQDTSDIPLDFQIVRDTTDLQFLSISSTWKPDISYDLIISDSAFVSYNQIYNDSTLLDFATLSSENLGTIRFNLTDLDSIQNYILTLLFKGNTIEEWTVSNKKEISLSLNNVLPLEYEFRYIEDRNRNGKWDTGDYKNKRQAERVVINKMEKLKANWELEVPVNPSLLK